MLRSSFISGKRKSSNHLMRVESEKVRPLKPNLGIALLFKHNIYIPQAT